jgi:hypothetical protein
MPGAGRGAAISEQIPGVPSFFHTAGPLALAIRWRQPLGLAGGSNAAGSRGT